MIRLNDNQKIKLKKLYLNKEYSKFQLEIEKLGELDSLPAFLKLGYAGSLVINNLSQKKDFLKAVSILDKVYNESGNIEALYNLIAASVKAKTYTSVIFHLNNIYNQNKKDPKILEGLAKINFDLGNIDLAVTYYHELESLGLDKTLDGCRMTKIFSMNYISKKTQKDFLNESKKMQIVYDTYFAYPDYINLKFKNKKLKIGFLSGDFKKHSVGFFLKGLIKYIQKENFELVAFSNLSLRKHDEFTKFFKENFNKWYDIIDLDNNNLISLIRSQNIDILIDLAGFSHGNRIDVFASRCAPVQVLWLGYNNTTGLKNMDFLITDPNLIKKKEESLYSEKILYLPKIWNAMDSEILLPDIVELNNFENQFFNFGSFNNFKKISNETIKVWSQILNNSNSKLYLKNSSGYNREVYKTLENKFQKNVNDINKIIFLKDKLTTHDHLSDYNLINLSLDTFPYTGVTTSFESYSMGVPVLTLKGFNFNSRCGESINKNLNLDELIADDYEDYIFKALNFLNKKKINLEFKKQLRKKVLNSPLYNIEDFSNEFVKLLKNL